MKVINKKEAGGDVRLRFKKDTPKGLSAPKPMTKLGAANSAKTEITTVVSQVKTLLGQEETFLKHASLNQLEADLRAFQIGGLIWNKVLNAGRGNRGEGTMNKFLAEMGWKKTTAYDYMALYRGADGDQDKFTRHSLPRAYWQTIGTKFEDECFFGRLVRDHLVNRPLLATDGQPDVPLLKEAKKHFLDRKKTLQWNPPFKVRQTKEGRVYDIDFDDTSIAGMCDLQQKVADWEADLSHLTGEKRAMLGATEYQLFGVPAAVKIPMAIIPQTSTATAAPKKMSLKQVMRNRNDIEGLLTYAKVATEFDQIRDLAKNGGDGAADGDTANLKVKVDAAQQCFRMDHCRFQDLVVAGAPLLPNEKPFAIVSDPPYTEEYTPKYSTFFHELGDFIHRNMDPNGMAALMIGHIWTQDILNALLEHQLELRWILPAVYEEGGWAKVHARRVFSCYKPVLVLMHKGAKLRKYIVGDVLYCGYRNKAAYEWQQDVETFEQIIDKITYPGQLVCDPCSGVGTTGCSSLNLKRRFLGCEVNLGRRNAAQGRLVDCFFNGNTGRKGYPEPRKFRSLFDAHGRLINKPEVEVIEEQP